MLRLPTLLRQCSAVSGRAAGHRSLSSPAGGGGGGDEQDDAKARVLEQAEKTHEPKDKQPKKATSAEKRANAKSKLSSLIANLDVQSGRARPDTSVEPQEQRHRAAVKLSKPKPTVWDSMSPEEQEERRQQRDIDPEISVAVKHVVKAVGGGEETRSELLNSLKNWQNNEPETMPASKIASVLSGLTVDQPSRSGGHRASQHSRRYERSNEVISSSSLFRAEPLNIFPVPPSTDQPQESEAAGPAPPILHTWAALEQKELELSIARPPANQFQEHALWTKQGKMWQFPIDNEIGMEEEKSVGFHEHIFLQRHLVPWCPRTGPIARFMELVCVGLSKNPHITVARKKTVIEWYRDYFESKKELLQEVGAMPTAGSGTPNQEARQQHLQD